MTKTFDLADLVAALVSLTIPSIEIDRIVHVMLAGKRPRASVSSLDVRLGTWIEDHVPSYTAGGQAISVLAFRRGIHVAVAPHGCGFRALAGDRIASGVIAGAAACAAIASHAAHALSREDSRDVVVACLTREPALAEAVGLGER